MIGNFNIHIQFLDYWKIHLWNSPTLGMIWSLFLQVEKPPKICYPSARKCIYKKVPPYLLGETLCPCSTGKSCGSICSLNICKEVQYLQWLTLDNWVCLLKNNPKDSNGATKQQLKNRLKRGNSDIPLFQYKVTVLFIFWLSVNVVNTCKIHC